MSIANKKIAFLVEDLYEDLELWYPYLRCKEAGATVVLIGREGKETYESKHGYPVTVDLAAQDASRNDFDAVVIPGGYAPDKMRRYQSMLNLVNGIFDRGGVVAFICHAGWVPISAGIVAGKTVTSVSAIQDDLKNAGAKWVDKEVVVDGNLISSRNPGDLPVFCAALLEALDD
ncbi:MAG TPA: type 1 glutamine amidotransferase domain-containing protein [Anaerolineales bacterium]|nr:type 1 glutamine amidotransferase domain-containing protein [Anaerolineales bacterium]